MRLLMQVEVIFQAVHDGGVNSEATRLAPPTNQSTVDIRFAKHFHRIPGLNAAAIQDGYGIGNIPDRTGRTSPHVYVYAFPAPARCWPFFRCRWPKWFHRQ